MVRPRVAGSARGAWRAKGAIQRLLVQGYVKAEWRQSETNRRARYYSLTPAGRKQYGIEVSQFEQLVAAIGRVLQTA